MFAFSIGDLNPTPRKFPPNPGVATSALPSALALASAPVLAFPDFGKPFCVASDCSDVAKGAVLFQIIDGVERPIAYYSKALNEHERKYGIYK